MYKQYRALHYFMHGMGTVINIFPNPKKNLSHSSYSSFHSDLISLRKDWNAIGKDFSNVCRSLEEGQKAFKSISKDRKKLYKALNRGQEIFKHT